MQSATVAENLRKSPLPGEVNGTAVPYLTVYRHTGKEAAIPDGASRYLYYIVDGSVRLHTPSGILDYVSGQYSLSAVDMPFRGEIVAPSVHGDFLALSVGFTADEVFGVLMSIEGNLAEKIAGGKLPRAFSERADGNVTDCIARLTALLDDGQSLQFMAGHLKREIIFNVLCGSCGSRLLQSIIGTNGGGIYDVNEWIKRNFKENFTVEDVARRACRRSTKSLKALSVWGFYSGAGLRHCRARRFRIRKTYRAVKSIRVLTEAPMCVIISKTPQKLLRGRYGASGT